MRPSTTVFDRKRRFAFGAPLLAALSCLPQDDLSSYSRAWAPSALPTDAMPPAIDAGALPPGGGQRPLPAPFGGDAAAPSPARDAGDAGGAGDAGADSGTDAGLPPADAGGAVGEPVALDAGGLDAGAPVSAAPAVASSVTTCSARGNELQPGTPGCS